MGHEDFVIRHNNTFKAGNDIALAVDQIFMKIPARILSSLIYQVSIKYAVRF